MSVLRVCLNSAVEAFNAVLCVGAEGPLAKVWAKIVVIEQDHPQSNFYVDLK